MNKDLGYDPEKFMKNSDGHLVPVENVSEVDKLTDKTISELIGVAILESERLGRLKAQAMGDVLALQEIVAEKYETTIGGKGGNMTLTSFDGKRRVQVAVAKTMEIDELHLNAAKKIIDECLTEWAEDSRPELKEVVSNAFKTSGKGRVDTKSILALMRLKIEDKRWKTAMAALQDGLRSDGSKTYIRFYQRSGTDNALKAIPLDIAKL